MQTSGTEQLPILLTPSGISEKVALTGYFLARKMQEHGKLSAEIEALKSEIVEYDVPSSQINPLDVVSRL